MARYKFAVSDLFMERGLTKAYRVGKAMKKPPAQAKRLFDPDRKQINIDVVNELCEFFDCSPGDLFRRVEERPLPKRHVKKRS